jgi:hypothetical protein
VNASIVAVLKRSVTSVIGEIAESGPHHIFKSDFFNTIGHQRTFASASDGGCYGRCQLRQQHIPIIQPARHGRGRNQASDRGLIAVSTLPV